MLHPTASYCSSATSFAVAALVMLGAGGCRNGPTDSRQAQLMAGKTIEQVQQEHTREWMALPGVVGTAIGQYHGRPCILILTASNTEQIRREIPRTVEGYAVIVQPAGEIHAFEE